MAKTTVPGFLPTLGHRVCCLMAAKLEFVHDLPFLHFIWPEIMIDLTGSRLNHRAGTGWWDMLLRREHSGTLYTCGGGFIDLGHLRDYADLTRHYYYALVRSAKNGVIPSGTQFDLLQSHGGITGHVFIQRDIPAANVTTDLKGIIDVARSISYDVSVIYEIQTWAQTRIGGRSSSFSPEDLVSNYLGTWVGWKALEIQIANSATLPTGPSNQLATTFDKAATQALADLLLRLHPVDVTKTREAFSKIDGLWVDSDKWPLAFPLPSPNFTNSGYVKRRNFHVRPVVPWLVRNLDVCIDTDWPDDVDRQLPDDAVTAHLSYYEFDEPFFDTLIFLNTDFDKYITKVKEAAKAEFGNNFDQQF